MLIVNQFNLEMDTTNFKDKQNRNCDLMSKIPDSLKSEPCILGIDEAGRGPVLGPMVYATCVCPVSRKDDLKSLRCDDSKVLSEEKREELFKILNQHTDDYIAWLVTILSPVFISTSMLGRTKYNLNAISHDTAINLIHSIINLGINITEVYVGRHSWSSRQIPGKIKAILSKCFNYSREKS